jgi:hypothetical protein
MTFKEGAYTACDLYWYAKKINGKLPDNLHTEMLLFSFKKRETVVPQSNCGEVFLKIYNDNNFWVKLYKEFVE